jgi:hypothetical protein
MSESESNDAVVPEQRRPYVEDGRCLCSLASSCCWYSAAAARPSRTSCSAARAHCPRKGARLDRRVRTGEPATGDQQRVKFDALLKKFPAAGVDEVKRSLLAEFDRSISYDDVKPAAGRRVRHPAYRGSG